MARAPSTTAGRWWSAAALTALLAVAFVVYQPWVPSPFDILDFSEFLSLLQAHDGVLRRFTALVQYYAAEHGRLNVLSYAALAAKWSLLGNDPVLWQMTRFVQMGLVVLGAYWLFRRLGVASAGAVAGASLFVAADAALEGWIRLTMGEPLGVVLALAASLLASGYQQAPRWRVRGLVIAALLSGALLAKEMLAGVVPFVLALGVLHQGVGRFLWPGWTPRTRWILAASTLSLGLVVAAIGVVARSVPADGFTALYGEGPTAWSRLGRTLSRMILPALTFRRGFQALTPTPNLIFVALIGVGFAAAMRATRYRLDTAALAAVAAAMPLVGTLLYLPWPQYHGFYGLPFLFGPALVLALAVAALYQQAPRVRWAVVTAVAVMVVSTGSMAQQIAGRTRATRVVNAGVAAALLDAPAVDSFIVVVGGRADQPWQGTGATLSRYAATLRPDAAPPAGVEATCSEVSPPGAVRGTVLIVVPQRSCGVSGAVLHVITQRFRYASWRDLAVVSDSVWSEVYLVSDGAGRVTPGEE